MNLDFEYILELKPTDKMLKVSEVVAMTGITKHYVYKLSKDETSGFPKPYLVGQQSRWINREVAEWMEKTNHPIMKKQNERDLSALKPLRQKLSGFVGRIGHLFGLPKTGVAESAGSTNAPIAGSSAATNIQKPAQR